MSDFSNVIHGIANVPKHIVAWIAGNSTAQNVETEALSFISGSYGIMVSILKKIAAADLKALEAGMLTAAETTFSATPGDILNKMKAAGAAALAAGAVLLAGDLAEAFKEVTEAEKANLLHTLSTAKTTEVSVPGSVQ